MESGIEVHHNEASNTSVLEKKFYGASELFQNFMVVVSAKIVILKSFSSNKIAKVVAIGRVVNLAFILAARHGSCYVD